MEKTLKNINICTVAVLIPALIIDYYFDLKVKGHIQLAGTIHLILLISFQMLSYMLVHFKKNVLASKITLASFCLAFIYFPAIPGIPEVEPIEDVIIIAFSTIAVSIVPLLIYDLNKQKLMIFFWQLIIITGFFSSQLISINKLTSPIEIELSNTVLSNPLLIAGYILIMTFVLLVLYNFKQQNETNRNRARLKENQVKSIINRIKAQNKLLWLQKSKTVEIQQELMKINDTMEERILDNTELITKRNKLLTQYGFLNSRLLLEPINDLIDCLQSDLYSNEILSLKIRNLEELSSDFSKFLNDEDHKDRNWVEETLINKYSRIA